MDERHVSEDSKRWRGHNNQLLVKEDTAGELMVALHLYISDTILEWLKTPDKKFMKLKEMLDAKINETCNEMGNRLPGGKNITAVDKKLVMAEAVLFGLELYGDAMFGRQIVRIKIGAEAQAEILQGAVESILNVAAKEE